MSRNGSPAASRSSRSRTSGIAAVSLKVTPTGPESAERYQQLADAVDTHCPVYDIFSHPTPIERTIAVPA